MFSETIELRGHIIDSLILPKVLDQILTHDANFKILEINIGKKRADQSFARIEVSTETGEALDELILRLRQQGAEVVERANAQLLLIETRALREPLNFSTSTKATRLLLVIRVCALCRCSVRPRIPISFNSSIRSLMPTNQSRPSFANSVRSCIAHTQRKGKSPLSPDRRLCGPARVSIWSDSLKQGILIGFSLEIRLRLTMWSAHCSEHHWE